MNASKQIVVRVDDEDVSIWLTKTGKVTWRASETFHGKHIDATGQSESSARSAWWIKADYVSKE